MTARGYEEFAGVYDELTQNVPYDEIADYYTKILEETAEGKRLLDLGCGTGNLTARLKEKGFDVVGLDGSSEMLSEAMAKNPDVMWICQDMTEIELGEEFDAVISTLDSINHLETKAEIERCFMRVNENLKTGGMFVFDVNTVYKHREILGNNTFVYDAEGAYCVWLNEFSEEDNGVSIDLDIFFEQEDGSYLRGGDSFREIALTDEEMCEILRKCGFEIVKIYDYLTFDLPNEKSEKLLVAARKAAVLQEGVMTSSAAVYEFNKKLTEAVKEKYPNTTASVVLNGDFIQDIVIELKENGITMRYSPYELYVCSEDYEQTINDFIGKWTKILTKQP